MELSAAAPAERVRIFPRSPVFSADLSPAAFQAWRALIVLVALAMHLYWLDGRPPHFDEGVNGWFTDQMQKTGFYQYDPRNYHGPLHFYVLFLFKCLFGRNLWALRLPTALVGVLTVDWIFRFGRLLDRRLCVLTALGMTFSSAMLYYQRDAIHETWLVFFLVLGMWGIFGLWQEGRKSQLWAVGLALAGMILTKETYIIHLGCLALGVPCLLLLESVQPSRATILAPSTLAAGSVDAPPPGLWQAEAPAWWTPLQETFAPQRWRAADAWTVAAVAAILVIFFYSGNFLNWNGITGLVTAYTPWGHKAVEGEGHNKVFSYWCKLFVRHEPFACLGVLACWRYAVPPLPVQGRRWQRWAGLGLVLVSTALLAFCVPTGWTPSAAGTWPAAAMAKAQGSFAWWLVPLLGLAVGVAALGLPAPPDWRIRLLAIVAPGTLAAYSIIPYKTPWCIISLLWPFFFVAGSLVVELADFASSSRAAEQPVHKLPWWTGQCLAWPLAALLLAGGAWQEFDLSYFRPTDEREDYVYVQTFNDMWDIVDPMLALADRDPTAYGMTGLILCGSAYPLPWMLGDFEHIGYYPDETPPRPEQIADADFLLAVDHQTATVEPMLRDTYYRQSVRLRSALESLTLYLRASRFRPVMDPSRVPEFQPAPVAPAAPAPAEPVVPGEPSAPATGGTGAAPSDSPP